MAAQANDQRGDLRRVQEAGGAAPEKEAVEREDLVPVELGLLIQGRQEIRHPLSLSNRIEIAVGTLGFAEGDVNIKAETGGVVHAHNLSVCRAFLTRCHAPLGKDHAQEHAAGGEQVIKPAAQVFQIWPEEAGAQGDEKDDAPNHGDEVTGPSYDNPINNT